MNTKRTRFFFLLFPLLLAAGAPATACAADTAPTEHDSARSGQQPSAGMLLLADFEKAKAETLVETACEPFTDSVLGGKSSVQLSTTSQGAQGTKAAVRMTGKLTQDFQFGGFVGFRTLLRREGGPKDLTAFTGVQFYARGDGKTYRVLVSKDSIKDNNHFFCEFIAGPEWTLFRVPFKKLAQSPYFGTQVPWAAGNIDAIGFMAQAEPGAAAEVRLDLDNVGFYTEK